NHRRESLQQTGCDTLVSLGKLREASDPQEALGYYMRATRLKPEREDAAFAAMRLCRDLGMREAAMRVYKRLAKILRDRLNVTPPRQVEQLAGQMESKS